MRQPFLDGARKLLTLGVDPSEVLRMRHHDGYQPGTYSLRSTVGEAAKWTVEETPDGHGPVLRKWKPFTWQPKSEQNE